MIINSSLSPISTHSQKGRHGLLALLMGMLGALIILLFFHLLEPPRSIVTVDVTGIITRFVQAETASKLPPDQLQQQVKTFGQVLDHTLKKIAYRQRVILLPREAVIAGAKDISREVEIQVHAAMTTSTTQPAKHG